MRSFQQSRAAALMSFPIGSYLFLYYLGDEDAGDVSRMAQAAWERTGKFMHEEVWN